MKDIKEFEDLYQIDETGNILNVKKQRVFKPKSTNSRGYVTTDLFKDGKRKGFTVHRLIAETYIPNPDNLPFINHKNALKWDNRVENLEWCTGSENSLHAVKMGLINHKGIKHPSTNFTEEDVLHIRSLANSMRGVDIAKLYGVTKTCISLIIRRKTWNHL